MTGWMVGSLEENQDIYVQNNQLDGLNSGWMVGSPNKNRLYVSKMTGWMVG